MKIIFWTKISYWFLDVDFPCTKFLLCFDIDICIHLSVICDAYHFVLSFISNLAPINQVDVCMYVSLCVYVGVHGCACLCCGCGSMRLCVCVCACVWVWVWLCGYVHVGVWFGGFVYFFFFLRPHVLRYKFVLFTLKTYKYLFGCNIVVKWLF